jgi:hypothetical protein
MDDDTGPQASSLGAHTRKKILEELIEERIAEIPERVPPGWRRFLGIDIDNCRPNLLHRLDDRCAATGLFLRE